MIAIKAHRQGGQMKITFLHHSGFLIESAACNVVCDVLQDGPDLERLTAYTGQIPPSQPRAQTQARDQAQIQVLAQANSQETVEDFATLFPQVELPHVEPWSVADGALARCLVEGFTTGKPCYFLASHFHQDHFPHWLVEMYSKLKGACESAGKANFMQLVLSRDIYKHRKHWVREFLDDIVWLKSGESVQFSNLRAGHLADNNKKLVEDSTQKTNTLSQTKLNGQFKVTAYGSTDVGVSFGLQLGDYSLFHAGDLNNWHWQEQSSAQESAQAEKEFLDILKSIKAQQETFDIAMFPGDSRMGQDYLRGAQQFLDCFATRVLMPMHASELRVELLADWRNQVTWPVLEFNADNAQANTLSLQPKVRPCIWCPVAEGSYLHVHKA